MKLPLNRSRVVALALAAAVAVGSVAAPAAAHPVGDPSAASMLSLALPVAVSVAAPVAILAGGAVLTVVSVQASTVGTVWVLERASDGARASIHFAGRAAEASAVTLGGAVVVTALSAGWVLSAAGQAIAFVPNEIGASLLHSEALTR